MKRFIAILAVILFIQGSSANAKMTTEAHAHYQNACQLEYQHKYEEAIQLIYAAIKENGDDAILYTKLAGLYTDLGDNQNALAAYKKAIKLRPNDAFIYISIGNILQNMNDYDNAYKSYMQAMELFPTYKYNYVNIANILYLQGNYSQAIDNYKMFLSAYPDHYEARENLANSYLRNNDFVKAIDEFGELYTKNPALFKDYASYGYALFKQGQYSTAIDMFKIALRNNNDNISTMSYLAISYQEVKRYNESKAMFDRIFELKPDCHGLRFNYAQLLADMKNIDGAVEQYKMYLKAYPEDINASIKLGLLYKNNKKYNEAIEIFTKVLEQDSSDMKTEKALAEAYHAKGDYTNALKHYNIVLENEENREALANKALVLHALKKYDEAISLYYDLLAEQSNDRLRNNLVEALCIKGDKMLVNAEFKNALNFYDKATEVDPNSAKANFGLAKAHDSLNFRDRADEYYQKAVSLDPNNKTYKTAYESFKQSLTVNDKAIEENEAKVDATISQTDSATAQSSVTPQQATASAESSIDDLMIKDKSNAIQDKSKTLITEGDSLYKQTRFDEALTKYIEALKINANDPVTAFKVGNLYKMQNDIDNAINYYKKATSLNKNYADAWFNLGLSYATLNNYRLCRECFNKVISLNPNYANAYYAMALSYEKDEDNANAVKYYKSYYNLVSDDKTKKAIASKISTLEANLP